MVTLPEHLWTYIFSFHNPYKDYFSRWVLLQFKSLYMSCSLCGYSFNDGELFHHTRFCPNAHLHTLHDRRGQVTPEKLLPFSI